MSSKEQIAIISANTQLLNEAQDILFRNWKCGALKAGIAVAATADTVISIMDIMTKLNETLIENINFSNSRFEKLEAKLLTLESSLERKGIAKEMWKKIRKNYNSIDEIAKFTAKNAIDLALSEFEYENNTKENPPNSNLEEYFVNRKNSR